MYLAVAHNDHSLIIFDALTHAHVGVLIGHKMGVTDISFSSSADLLCSSSEDKTVRVWDVASRKMAILLPHSYGVISACFSSCGSKVLSRCRNGVITQWDLNTHQPTLSFHIPGFKTCKAFLTSGGDRIVSLQPADTDVEGHLSLADKVKVWDAETGEECMKFDGITDQIPCFAVTNVGDLVAAGTMEVTVLVWEVCDKQPRLVLRGHKVSVCCISFNTTGSRIASGSDDKTVKIWDCYSGALLFDLVYGRRAKQLSFNADDTRIVCRPRYRGTMSVLEISSGKNVLEIHDAACVCYSQSSVILL